MFLPVLRSRTFVQRNYLEKGTFIFFARHWEFLPGETGKKDQCPLFEIVGDIQTQLG
jgi:hypothetical protein